MTLLSWSFFPPGLGGSGLLIDDDVDCEYVCSFLVFIMGPSGEYCGDSPCCDACLFFCRSADLVLLCGVCCVYEGDTQRQIEREGGGGRGRGGPGSIVCTKLCLVRRCARCACVCMCLPCRFLFTRTGQSTGHDTARHATCMFVCAP